MASLLPHRRQSDAEEGTMATRFPIQELLRGSHVAYAVVPHHSAVFAQDETTDTHVPALNWAKVVTYFVDGEPVEAVLPVAMTANLDRLLGLARGRDIRLARNEELQRLFPECQTRTTASDPQYASVIVDVALAAENEILFNADVLSETIHLRWADFAASVRPIVGRFAEPPLDRVGGFRLSYRE
jgi:prolyl-tRNA editing enzyme YbaK/EbsC (Cys-tRNA(Pro) deacylase)